MIFQTAGMNDRLSIDSSGATFAGNVVSQGEVVQYGSTDSDTRIIFSSKGGAYSSGSSNAFHNLRGHGTGVILTCQTSQSSGTLWHGVNTNGSTSSWIKEDGSVNDGGEKLLKN